VRSVQTRRFLPDVVFITVNWIGQSGKPYINNITTGGHKLKGDLGELFGAGGTGPEYGYFSG
jgi:hypothetical protein